MNIKHESFWMYFTQSRSYIFNRIKSIVEEYDEAVDTTPTLCHNEETKSVRTIKRVIKNVELSSLFYLARDMRGMVELDPWEEDCFLRASELIFKEDC